MTQLTDKQLRETVAVYSSSPSSTAAATSLGISVSALRSRLTTAEQRFGEKIERHVGKVTIDLQPAQEALDAYVLVGSKQGAARKLGISYGTLHTRLEIAARENLVSSIGGTVDEKKARVLPLPPEGKIARYFVTTAQSETKLHDATWRAVHSLAEHYGEQENSFCADVMVATFSYKHSAQGSAKRGTSKDTGDDWYDSRIEPYVVDEMVQLAPGLIWNGHMNILPTAVNPLSGMESYNGRSSSIFPHAKVAMQSVPTIRSDAAKLQYTTGTVTQRNYIQKKAGQKAEFDHVYGALIVEVDHTGLWFVRQLNVDSKGGLYDLDLYVSPSGIVERSARVEGLVWGDVHVAQLEAGMRDLCWGTGDGAARPGHLRVGGSIIDTLRPKVQFMHDVLDFESRSHHNRLDPHKRLQLHVEGRDLVGEEVREVAHFLRDAGRAGTRTVIVQSNHDLHLERWLKEADWRFDTKNARFYVDCQKAYVDAIYDRREFNALRWAVEREVKLKNTKWLSADEPYILCKDSSGGIEMALHGDRGPNGARGSIKNLSRLGRKVCIGHSHSAGIYNGAYQSGVTARLDMDYGKGAPSSWTQSHIVVHRNGKRQIITCYKGKWRA